MEKDKNRYTEAEKKRILEQLNEQRRQEQKARESLRRYLSDKKVYRYRGSEYYKVKDYKSAFYIKSSIIRSLDATVQEVELERTGYTSNRTQRGFIKWDSMQEKILLSESKVRIYYKPFEIECV